MLTVGIKLAYRFKLSVLLENQVSTWVSVTAKGEDIAKYVDLRGPVPGVAGLQPVCPSIGRCFAIVITRILKSLDITSLNFFE